MKIPYLITLLLFSFFTLAAQPRWELGVGVGATNYLGDLNLNWYPYLKESQLCYEGLLRYHLNPAWALRLNYLGGKISGDDANFDERRMRGFTFSSTFHEAALLVEWDAHGRQRYADGNFHRTVSTFLFAGPAVAFFDPSPDFNDRTAPNPVANDEKIAEDRAAKTDDPVPAIAFGGGFKFDLSRTALLGLELGVRPTFSDLIDGISASGNQDQNDWYMYAGLTLSFRLAKKEPDTDQDGIIDRLDQCPQASGPASFGGCPDSDGDGIIDKIDACPQTAGSTAFRGCPDSDSDGIMDSEDACPDRAGLAALKGCPDADRDGIPDAEDACPDVAGPAQYKGCPDSDGDGIPDRTDKCPQEAGTIALSGCPLRDADGDGVPDADDKCPNLAGPASTGGCPEMKIEDKEKLYLAVRQIQFETGSDRLKAGSAPVLNQIATILQNYPNYQVAIGGHTDDVGSAASNLSLSDRRAQRCREYLVGKGIDAGRLSAKGFGESKPIATNKTAAGRQKNRRVEFELIQKM